MGETKKTGSSGGEDPKAFSGAIQASSGAGESGGGTRPPLPVQLQPSGPATPFPSLAFWKAIRAATGRIEFRKLDAFLKKLFCEDSDEGRMDVNALAGPLPTHLHGIHAYRLLRTAVELFLLLNCGLLQRSKLDDPWSAETLRKKIEEAGLTGYLGSPADLDRLFELPYFRHIRTTSLQGTTELADDPLCIGVLRDRVDIKTAPCLVELIWNYWHEQGALVQSINMVALRFQNRIDPQGRNPLTNLNLAPLHGISPLLFGYIQDEYNRLTIQRRAYEYDHHYGLTLYGKAVQPLSSADSRSKFIEAFHHLLHRTTRYYRQADDLTVRADGFPVLQALKDVHLLLTQGMHNQFGDLPWTARVEMLVQEWLLARPEIAQFLNSRPMVPYTEGWMAQVDTLKQMFGWSDASVSHFRDLGVFGERVLLSIRYHLWLQETNPEVAGEWALEWRPEIQSYIHAYRAVTGVDLMIEPVSTTPPSILLRDRLPGRAAATT